MIIGEDKRGSSRLKVDIFEAKGTESTGNSGNRTYSLYIPEFWKVFNEIGGVLFNNFLVTMGRQQDYTGDKRIRVLLKEAIQNQQDGKSRSFSVHGASVDEVRDLVEQKLRSNYEESESGSEDSFWSW